MRWPAGRAGPRRFSLLLAREEDPGEVVQSTYKSFVARHRAGRLDVSGWDGLWSPLTLITLCKCADRAGYLLADRRDAAREATGPTGGDGPIAWLVALYLAAMLRQYRREAPAVQGSAQATTAIATEHRPSFWRAGGIVLRGGRTLS